MRLAFLIPFRTDNGHRQRLYDYVTDRIKLFFPDAGIYTHAGMESTEFNRSAAINHAFTMMKGEEIVIVNDADTVWNASSILGGIFSLVHDGRFVIPYTRYNILDIPSTESILEDDVGRILAHTSYDYDIVVEANRHVFHAPPVSGVVMLRSTDFEALGGFDSRFIGWGEEDVAFTIRASKLLGRPVRCMGDVWHLWHPRGADYSQPHYKQNQSLLKKEYL